MTCSILFFCFFSLLYIHTSFIHTYVQADQETIHLITQLTACVCVSVCIKREAASIDRARSRGEERQEEGQAGIT